MPTPCRLACVPPLRPYRVGKGALSGVPGEGLSSRRCPPYEIWFEIWACFIAPIVGGAGDAVFPIAPKKPRGAERRQALARNAVPVARLAVGPVSPAKGDLPASDVGRRAFRRATAAFFGPGPRFIGPAHRPSSASSSRPARNGRRAVPRAARVLGCEPSPQGPHLAPPSRRLRRRPSKSKAVGDIAHPRNIRKQKVFTVS